MRLLGHILQSDLRRLRWLVAGWLGFHGAKLGLGFWIIGGGNINPEVYRRLEIITGLLIPGEMLLAFLFTAWLVQGDGLVGSRQFWMTRPISGGRLLAAKALGAAVLLVVPAVLLAVPWWLACGLDAPMMLAAAVDACCWLGFAILPAFLLASLTDSLGRFLLWSLVGVWSAAMAIFYAQWLWVKLAGVAAEATRGPTGDQLWLMAFAMMLVIAGVVGRQYRHRDLGRSVLWLLGGASAALMLGTIGVGGAAALPNSDHRGAAAETGTAPSVRLEWEGGTVEKRTADPSRQAWVNLRLRASGWPVDLELWGGAATLTWRWAGGPEYRNTSYINTMSLRTQSLNHALRVPDPGPDAETEAWLRDLAAKKGRRAPATTAEPELMVETSRGHAPGVKAPTGEAAGGIITVHAGLPRSLAARAQQERTGLQLHLELALRRSQPQVDMPLRPGGWKADAGLGLRVVEIAEQSRVRADGAGRQREIKDVRTVESCVAFTTDPGERLAVRLTGREFKWWRWGARRPVAAHPRYGVGDLTQYTGSPMLRIASVALRMGHFGVGAPMLVRDGQWVRKYADWFEEAALFNVNWALVEKFTREVQVDTILVGR